MAPSSVVPHIRPLVPALYTLEVQVHTLEGRLPFDRCVPLAALWARRVIRPLERRVRSHIPRQHQRPLVSPMLEHLPVHTTLLGLHVLFVPSDRAPVHEPLP